MANLSKSRDGEADVEEIVFSDRALNLKAEKLANLLLTTDDAH